MNAKRLLLSGLLIALSVAPPPAFAATTLTVSPITWNVIGLDSNLVTVGPNHFPIGVRICNTGVSTAIGVQATFNWDSANTYVDIRPGTLSTLSLGNLNSGACIDAYYEVEVTRTSSAYDTTRRYHISVTADSGATTASSPTPRELYVEHLVSQARNAVTDMQWSTTGGGGTFRSVPNGGNFALMKDGTYWIKLVGTTATNGYEQIESFINFPNTIFQVLSVATTYNAETSATMAPPYDRLYGDACGWINDPNDPAYRSCVGTGKAGGDITVTYQVKILSVPSAPLVNPEPLGTLIYDFSGSSFHYNADYGVSSRFVTIVDPTQLTLKKSFSPNPIGVNGVSVLKIEIGNPFAGTIADVNISDNLPTSPAAMVIATTPNANLSGCGSAAALTANAGATSLSMTGATLSPNSSCNITVNVTAPSTGTYANTTNLLYVGTVSTGKTASADLTVNTAPTPPAPPSFCTSPVVMASWSFPTTGQGSGGSSNAIRDWTTKQSDVGTATTNYVSVTGVPSIEPTGSAAANSWGGTAPTTDPGPPIKSKGWLETPTSMANYFEFTVDTSKYGGVYTKFNVGLFGNDWANPTSNVYVNIDGGSGFNVYTRTVAPIYPQASKGGWVTGLTAVANAASSGNTVFRFGCDGSSTAAAKMQLDDVQFYGCPKILPPTVTKSFSPSTVAVGATSTLTLTVTNPNAYVGQTLTGINIDDYLPSQDLQGTVSATNGNATVTGTGTAFDTQLVGGSILTIPSTPENLSGTVAVTNGSATVTGTSTTFTTDLARGSAITIGSVTYTVADVISNTDLRLTVNYAGTTASGLTVGMFRRYTVSTVDSATSLTLTATYAGTTASGVTIGAGLTLTAAPTTTCKGTVTGASGRSAISLSGDRLQGVIAVTNGNTGVTGTGSAFLTQLSVGSRINIGGVDYRVATIGSDTALTLSSNYGGSTASNLIYRYGSDLTGTVNMTNGSTAVTGVGTAFNTQLVAGDIVYVRDNVANNWVRATVASIASATAMTLSANYTGDTGTLQKITANDTLRGTATATNGSANITAGVGTLFNRELVPGDKIYIDGTQYTVNTITSDTALTLTTNFTGTTGAGKIIHVPVNAGLPGGGSTAATCSITATVKANSAGVRTNISGTVSSTEAGRNTGSNGYATAKLAALLPPVISKTFSPSPILANGVSTLTFTIRNPNPDDAISGVKFTDTFPVSPGAMVTATPLVTNNTCGGTLYQGDGTTALPAASPSLRLGSSTDTNTGTIAAGGSCTITVQVTAPTVSGSLTGTVAVTNNSTTVTGTGTMFNTALAVGRTIYINSERCVVASITSDTSLTLTAAYSGATASGITVRSGYFNISGSVAYIIGGSTVTGNTATDTLIVNAANPKIAIKKEVGTSVTGPWYSYLNTTAGTNLWYQFTIENIGDVPLNPVTVSDPTLAGGVNPSGCTWTNPLPVASPTQDPTQSCVRGSIAAVAGKNENIATAHGTYSGTVYNSTPDTATYATVGLSIVKSVTENRYAAAGDLLHYSYLVTNSGYAPLEGPVTVSDDKIASVSCPSPTTVGDNDNFLDPASTSPVIAAESVTCTATYTVTAADINACNQTTKICAITNIASAAADSVTSGTDTKTVRYYGPTLAFLSDFGASFENGRVRVRWTTASETDTAGFILYRLDAATGAETQVSGKILPALLTEPQGGTYSVVDKGVSRGQTATYRLVEVETGGGRNSYGPFTITIDGNDAVQPAAVAAGDGIAAGDELFDGYSRKPHQLSPGKALRLRSREAALEKARGQRKTRTGAIAKILVEKGGLHRVGAEQIASVFGLPLGTVKKQIKQGKLALSSQGAQIAYLPAGDDSALYFYGEAIDSIYAKSNVYWLAQGKGLLMRQIKGKGPAGGSEGVFAEIKRFEEDKFAAITAVRDPESDYWFWASIVAIPGTTLEKKSFTAHVDGVSGLSGEIGLTLSVLGYSEANHHVVVRLNGSALTPDESGSDAWSGMQPRTIRYTTRQDLLLEGGNTVEIEGLPASGWMPSILFVDSFEISYQRRYQAVGDSLLLRGDANPVVTVSGFSSPDVFVFDLTTPQRPKWVDTATVSGEAGNYQVAFRPSSQENIYLASTASVAAPVDAWAESPANLASPANGADYLLVTTAELADAGAAYAAHWQARGLTTKVVLMEDIVNEFNHGIAGPDALHDFLAHAHTTWSTPPRFVLLAGEGTYDYKDIMGFKDNLIPVKMQATPFGIAPADNSFADVDGDYVPDMAIGRLPVATGAELLAMLAKLESFDPGKTTQLLWVADNADRGGDFPADSDLVAETTLPGYALSKIYLSVKPWAVARKLLLDGIAAGALYVNYTGHAAIDRLEEGGLLRASDVPNMTNTVLPVVTALTCVAGQFSYPGYDSLSESLVTRQGGGAIAFFGSTAMAYNPDSVELGRLFYESVFTEGVTELGVAVKRALEKFRARDEYPYILDVYTLQGDPALRITP